VCVCVCVSAHSISEFYGRVARQEWPPGRFMQLLDARGTVRANSKARVIALSGHLERDDDVATVARRATIRTAGQRLRPLGLDSV
jgi:hypothetical protein